MDETSALCATAGGAVRVHSNAEMWHFDISEIDELEPCRWCEKTTLHDGATFFLQCDACGAYFDNVCAQVPKRMGDDVPVFVCGMDLAASLRYFKRQPQHGM